MKTFSMGTMARFRSSCEMQKIEHRGSPSIWQADKMQEVCRNLPPPLTSFFARVGQSSLSSSWSLCRTAVQAGLPRFINAFRLGWLKTRTAWSTKWGAISRTPAEPNCVRSRTKSPMATPQRGCCLFTVKGKHNFRQNDLFLLAVHVMI